MLLHLRGSGESESGLGESWFVLDWCTVDFLDIDPFLVMWRVGQKLPKVESSLLEVLRLCVQLEDLDLGISTRNGVIYIRGIE